MNSGSCTCTFRLSHSFQTTRHSRPTGSSLNAALIDVHPTRNITQTNYIIKNVRLKSQFQISQLRSRDEFHKVVLTTEIIYSFIYWQVCAGISVVQFNNLFLLWWWFFSNHSWLIALIFMTENQLLQKQRGWRHGTQFLPLWRQFHTLHWDKTHCIKLTSS